MENSKTKDIAITKLLKLPIEEVSKVLIFMAGLEAAYNLNKTDVLPEKENNPQSA